MATKFDFGCHQPRFLQTSLSVQVILGRADGLMAKTQHVFAILA